MNWLKKLYHKEKPVQEVMKSLLYNENTFYDQFVTDLLAAKEEVIIESPYITKKRLCMLKPIFTKLIEQGIRIVIITKAPHEHDVLLAEQAETGIRYFEDLGAQVLLIGGGHHRKLAMIDRNIVWEGSLNILSQACSREFMRRLESKKLTNELFKFLRLDTIDVFNQRLDLL